MTFFDAYMSALREALFPSKVLPDGVEEQHGIAVCHMGAELIEFPPWLRL